MQTIGTPLQIPELNLSPEQQSGVQLSADMQQTLALLTAFWRNERVVLRASPSGALMVTAAQLKDVYHVTGVGANDTYQGSNHKCSEVLVMGHPDNTGKVWVRSHAVATVNNAWPLGAGEVIDVTIINLNMLHALIVVDGEKLIVAYAE